MALFVKKRGRSGQKGLDLGRWERKCIPLFVCFYRFVSVFMPIPRCRASPLSWSNQAQNQAFRFWIDNAGEVPNIQLTGLLAIFMCGLLYRDSSGCDIQHGLAWALQQETGWRIFPLMWIFMCVALPFIQWRIGLNYFRWCFSLWHPTMH